MHIYQVEMCCVWSCDDVARLSAKVHRSLKDGLPLFLVLFIDLVAVSYTHLTLPTIYSV